MNVLVRISAITQKLYQEEQNFLKERRKEYY